MGALIKINLPHGILVKQVKSDELTRTIADCITNRVTFEIIRYVSDKEQS